MRVSSLMKGAWFVLEIALSMFLVWITLGLRVRRTRRAFERELIRSGMPADSARELSRIFPETKDQIMSQVWGSIGRFRGLGRQAARRSKS